MPSFMRFTRSLNFVLFTSSLALATISTFIPWFSLSFLRGSRMAASKWVTQTMWDIKHKSGNAAFPTFLRAGQDPKLGPRHQNQGLWELKAKQPQLQHWQRSCWRALHWPFLVCSLTCKIDDFWVLLSSSAFPTHMAIKSTPLKRPSAPSA